jgi:hypothetical protein
MPDYMNNEQFLDGELTSDDFASGNASAAHMNSVAAFLFGAWYAIVFAAAMTAGVKYLHSETPDAHGLLDSTAWAIGSGMGIALATRLAKSHRIQVGLASTFVSVGVWIAFLYAFRHSLNVATGDLLFGLSLSVGTYLIIISALVLIVGLVSTFMGAVSRNDEELTGTLLQIPSGHWFWLWIAGFGWVSMFPIVVYYFWLQVAVGIYSFVHPSLWFQVGTDAFFGFLGMAALVIGIEISLKAVSDKESYGGAVWKRVLVFLAGAVVLSGVISPLLLNLDIGRLKDMPASLGAHPWWVL